MMVVPAAPPPKITAAVFALALSVTAIVLGGLAIVFNVAFDLLRPLSPGYTHSGDVTPIAGIMVVFGSGLIAVVSALLIRIFGHLILSRTQHHAPQPAKEIVAAPAAVQLPAAPASIGSVTEHTTRNFEPRAYSELGARE